MNGRLLLACDAGQGLETALTTLTSAGFEVDQIDSEVVKARVDDYDLVVVDLADAAPEVCSALRRRSAVPIVILAASGDQLDTVRGLELGADDYVTKPFSPAELVSRIRAILRRRALDRLSAVATTRAGPLSLDLTEQTLRVDGSLVEVSPAEFRLLALLAAEPGRAFSRSELMARISHRSRAGRERTCDVHVKNLRRKIERDPARPERLITVRGLGYMLREA
jgi:two-component system response regulator RegX3